MSSACIKTDDRIRCRHQGRKRERNRRREDDDRNAAVRFILIKARLRAMLSAGVDGWAIRGYVRKAAGSDTRQQKDN